MPDAIDSEATLKSRLLMRLLKILDRMPVHVWKMYIVSRKLNMGYIYENGHSAQLEAACA